jgi:hypothetical protein
MGTVGDPEKVKVRGHFCRDSLLDRNCIKQANHILTTNWSLIFMGKDYF